MNLVSGEIKVRSCGQQSREKSQLFPEKKTNGFTLDDIDGTLWVDAKCEVS